MRTIQRIVLMSFMALLALHTAKAYAQPATKHVLMALWRGPTETEASFKLALEQMGVHAEYTEINGNQDRATLATALRDRIDEINSGKFDVIYSYGTTVTSVAIQVVEGKLPVVFNIVFDPVGANLVDSMEKPGRNMTGVTNGVPIETQFNAFNALKPFKNCVVLFNAREANANIIESQVQAWGAAANVAVNAIRVAPNTDTLDQALEQIKSGAIPCDMLYAGADTYLASRAKDIVAVLGDSIPLFGGTGTFVKNGWLGAFSPTLDDMGRTAAEQVKKVLDGSPAGDMPVVLPKPAIILSKSAAERFGIAIPAGAVVENN